MLKKIIITIALASFFTSCVVIDLDTKPVRVEPRRIMVHSSPMYYGWYGWWSPFWIYGYYSHYGAYNPFFWNYYFRTHNNGYHGTIEIGPNSRRKIVTTITKTQLKDSRGNTTSSRKRVSTISSGSTVSSTSSSSSSRTRITKSSSSSSRKASSGKTTKTIKKK